MNIWNNRFKENGWSTTSAYVKAKQSGFCIEALVLSNNMLKALLFTILENEYRSMKKTQKKIDSLLSKKKDVGDLIKLLEDINVITPTEKKKLTKFWKARNDTVHNFIDGNIPYSEVCEQVNAFSQIYGEMQNKLFTISMSETNTK